MSLKTMAAMGAPSDVITMLRSSVVSVFGSIRSLLFAGVVVVAAKQGTTTHKAPNVIVMLADNLGYNDIGIFGAPTAQTPNIDRLGHEGFKFLHWNSAAHLCSASRAALLTGQYPVRLGVFPGVFHPDATHGLEPCNDYSCNSTDGDDDCGKNYTTMAAALKQRGYATFIVGKWHLGHLPPYLPTNHGFDEWLGIPYHMSGGSVDYHTCAMDENETMWLPLYQNQEIIEQPVQLNTLADRYAQQAIDFITHASSSSSSSLEEQQPFFLFLSFSHVHQLCAPRDWPLFETCQWSKKKMGTAAGASNFVDAVEEMDWISGRVLTVLDNLGLTNDTIVWFTSDNGPWVAEQVCSGSKGPFEGRWLQDHTSTSCTACPHDYVPLYHPAIAYGDGDSVHPQPPPQQQHTCHLPGTSLTLAGVPCGHDTGLGSTWEANLRMPALVRWPHRIAARSQTHLSVSTLDLLPTILAIVDQQQQQQQQLISQDKTSTYHHHHHRFHVDGLDLSALLLMDQHGDKDNKNNKDALIAQLSEHGRALFFWRDGFQEGNLPQPFGREDVAALKLGQYKFWFWTKSGHYNNDVEQYHDPPLLFDVLTDPAEAYPLDIDSNPLYPTLVNRAKTLLQQHKQSITLGPPLTLGRNASGVPCVNPETNCRTHPPPHNSNEELANEKNSEAAQL